MVKRTLGSLLDLKDSGVWGDEDAELGVSILRSTNFQDDGTLNLHKLTHRKLEERDAVRKLLAAGDILLEKSGGGPKQPVGRVCFFEGDSQPHTFSNFIARLRATHEAVPKYLFYFLRHFHATGKTEGYQKQTTGIRNLEFKRFLDIELPLPPLDEQQRIVDILDRAVSIQRLRQAADEKLKQIIPALFVDMFGDTAQIKDRWPQMRLDEVADIGSGITKGRQIDPAEAIEVPYLRVANVQDGYLDMDEIKTITIRRTEQAKYALQHGDIVMTEGGDLDKLGRGYVWANELPYCAHQNHVFKVRPRQQLVSPYFLATYVGSPAGKDYFLRVAKRTTGIASINKTQLSALPVPVPPIELQRAFELKLADLRSIQGLGTRSTNAALQMAASVSSAFFSAA